MLNSSRVNSYMPKPEIEFSFLTELPWQPIKGLGGLSEKILSRDKDSGDYTRLLRFEPGADSSPMGVQKHDFWEEVYILNGSLHDISLGETFSAGMYACRPPGMPHGPWTSADGCMTFEIRYYKK